MCLFRKLARARSALGSRVFTIIDTRGDCVFEKPTKSNRGKLRARFYTYIAAQRSAIILLLRVCAVQWCSLLSRAGHLYSISAAHIRPMCAGTAFCTLKISKCVVFLSPAKRARKHSTHRHNHIHFSTHTQKNARQAKSLYTSCVVIARLTRVIISYLYIYSTLENHRIICTHFTWSRPAVLPRRCIYYMSLWVWVRMFICAERVSVCVCLCGVSVWSCITVYSRAYNGIRANVCAEIVNAHSRYANLKGRRSRIYSILYMTLQGEVSIIWQLHINYLFTAMELTTIILCN